MKTLRVITTLSIGVTAGLIAGYLTAPWSGKRTRRKFARKMHSQFKSLENGLNDKVSEIIDEYTEQIDNLTSDGKSILKKAKNMVSNN